MTAAARGVAADRRVAEERLRPSQPRLDARAVPSVRTQASLRRRLRFADLWRHRTDSIWTRIGIECPPAVGRVMDLAAQLAFDLVETVRAGERIDCPGRVHEAAFNAPLRLPQQPRSRGYWYDAADHILVGMHLGLDINHSDGKYYVVESNTHPALRPDRRRLYADDLDPIITNLIAVAKRFDFERIVFHRARAWSRAYLNEFARASEASGIEIVGASLPFVRATKRPIVPLPKRWQAKTIYVGSWSQGTPVSLFMHDKARVGRWLTDQLEREGDPAGRLACIPTSDCMMMPSRSIAPCWPTLVAKLANSDGGNFVAMGRFESQEHARRELGLDKGEQRVPACFRRRWPARSISASKVVWQPFIPPEVVGRRARLIRTHLFVSPLVDSYLSGHGVLAGKDLPEELPFGLVRDRAPYVVNFSTGGSYAGLEPSTEADLHAVVREFGRLANLAIARKFEVGDAPRAARA